MAFLKNRAGQAVRLFAYNLTTGSPVTGDALNITVHIQKDGGSSTATTTTHPSEVSAGYYDMPLTQSECNCDILDVLPASTTSGVEVLGVPGRIFPEAAASTATTSATVGTTNTQAANNLSLAINRVCAEIANIATYAKPWYVITHEDGRGEVRSTVEYRTYLEQSLDRLIETRQKLEEPFRLKVGRSRRWR